MVSEALVQTDDKEVVVTLLSNDEAQFSDDTYQYLANSPLTKSSLDEVGMV